MTNSSKKRGTAFESLVRDFLKEKWDPTIERLPLSGSEDRGDIANFRVGSNRQHLVALELKCRAQLSLGQWVAEAQREAKNYGAVAGATVFKRKGKGAAQDQFVVMTLDDWLTVLHAAAS